MIFTLSKLVCLGKSNNNSNNNNLDHNKKSSHMMTASSEWKGIVCYKETALLKIFSDI